MNKLLVTLLVGISALTIGRGDAIVIKGSDTLGASSFRSWRSNLRRNIRERPLILRRKDRPLALPR